MHTPLATSDEPFAPLTPADAMAIVAAERLRLHEKIIRLRALREAAEPEQRLGKEKTRHGRVWVPA